MSTSSTGKAMFRSASGGNAPKSYKGSLPLLEGACYVIGTAFLALGLGAFAHSELQGAAATRSIPDMQRWSDSAKARYVEAIVAEPAPTVGTLQIPRLGLQVPIYAAASELNLDRGAGVIDGMAYPHELGHIGIAGHRDGYFRALQDLELGDRIELETLYGEKVFEVDDLRVVESSEIAYLAETADQRLSIVTCYPFYFAGSAPQRFLARAVAIDAGTTKLSINAGVPSK